MYIILSEVLVLLSHVTKLETLKNVGYVLAILSIAYLLWRYKDFTVTFKLFSGILAGLIYYFIITPIYIYVILSLDLVSFSISGLNFKQTIIVYLIYIMFPVYIVVSLKLCAFLSKKISLTNS